MTAVRCITTHCVGQMSEMICVRELITAHHVPYVENRGTLFQQLTAQIMMLLRGDSAYTSIVKAIMAGKLAF